MSALARSGRRSWKRRSAFAARRKMGAPWFGVLELGKFGYQRLRMNDGNNKAYLIYIRGQARGESYLVTNAVREEFLGIACIKGTYHLSTSASHWMADRVLYIPLENV